MDGDNTPKVAKDGQNLYQPDDVIRPGAAPVPAVTPTSTVTQQPQPKAQQAHAATTDQGSITWTASEFIAHQKSGTWYAAFILGAFVVAAIVWLLTRDPFPSVAVAIGVGLLGYYAGKQPREQTYTLDASGLTIGERHYSYNQFRSFAAEPEGAFLSIELMPFKRTAMYTTVYVDPADENAILNLLSRYLPMEESHANLADTFMRRIHF